MTMSVTIVPDMLRISSKDGKVLFSKTTFNKDNGEVESGSDKGYRFPNNLFLLKKGKLSAV